MEPEKSVRGIRITTINKLMIVASAVFFVMLIAITVGISRQYQGLLQTSEEFAACEQAGSELMDASDYLTEQVRLYVQERDPKYMNNYFREANEDRHREAALDQLKAHDPSESVLASLESAMQSSVDLMEREIYAMRLVSLSIALAEEELPEEVRSTALKAVDRDLTEQEMLEKARELVFDTGYQDAKHLIQSHLQHFLDGVYGKLADSNAQAKATLEKSLTNQRLLICALFILNVINFVAITLLIVRPLSVHVQHIADNNRLLITGAYEFKYLALTYNNIYDLNASNEAVLRHRAEHDPLTGLINRSGYDQLCNYLRESVRPVTLVLIDVDRFKDVNDTFGHEAGDKLLKKVADLLELSFRSTDYAIRYGGDEFALILPELKFEDLDVIKRKLAQINETLRYPRDDLPPVSLSAGMAYSDCGFSDDLFNRADEALYYVKEHGRGATCLWQEMKEKR